MKHNEDNLAHALDLALELKRKGVPTREILTRFPQFRGELEPLLLLGEAVERGKEKITPSRALLSRILNHLGGSVTEARDPRFKRGGYGRASFVSFVKNAMSPFRLIVPVGAVILLLLIVGIREFGSEKPEQLSLRVDELEDEVRDIEALGGGEILGESGGEGAVSGSKIAVPAPAAPGAPAEPPSPAVEQAAVVSDGEQLENDFSEFDEFSRNDAEIDQAFNEF